MHIMENDSIWFILFFNHQNIQINLIFCEIMTEKIVVLYGHK